MTRLFVFDILCRNAARTEFGMKNSLITQTETNKHTHKKKKLMLTYTRCSCILDILGPLGVLWGVKVGNLSCINWSYKTKKNSCHAPLCYTVLSWYNTTQMFLNIWLKCFTQSYKSFNSKVCLDVWNYVGRNIEV